MTTNVILQNPPEYDLQALAVTTREALTLLRPWTLLDTTNNPLAARIVAQARQYVSAIQMGVSAAYSGFTMTEEVLFLISTLPTEDEDDLQDYLVGMMELARGARENSNKAFEACRNVRHEIFATMSNVKEAIRLLNDHGNQVSTFNNRTVSRHSFDVIDVLVKFSDSISLFVNWWDWVKIEVEPSSTKAQPISFNWDALREASTLKRWETLKFQYTTYVQMIGELEDTYPALFKSVVVSPPNVQYSSSSVTALPALLAPRRMEANQTALTKTEDNCRPLRASESTAHTPLLIPRPQNQAQTYPLAGQAGHQEYPAVSNNHFEKPRKVSIRERFATHIETKDNSVKAIIQRQSKNVVPNNIIKKLMKFAFRPSKPHRPPTPSSNFSVPTFYTVFAASQSSVQTLRVETNNIKSLMDGLPLSEEPQPLTPSSQNSVPTVYSAAPSSLETEYGLFYIHRYGSTDSLSSNGTLSDHINGRSNWCW